MKVNVYINEWKNRRLMGSYSPGDPLTLALSFEAEAKSALDLCDLVFAALNRDNPNPLGTLDVARIAAYHKVYPSLSVGDVAEVDGQKYACQIVGWLPVEMPKGTPKFLLGQFVATPAVLATGVDIQPLLARHASGDWGDLCASDKVRNEDALAIGERLMSSYETPEGSVWIITEADRSVTTVVLPGE